MNSRRLLTPILAFVILLAAGAPVGALSVFLSGPGVVNNYPPNNVISMRVMTETTSETTVTWGLQGGGGFSYLMGTIQIPANQHVGFGSTALPAGFPPGVYTLYANEAGTIAYGPTMAMGRTLPPEGKAPPIDDSLDRLEHDVNTILRSSPGSGPALRPFLFGLLAAERDSTRREHLERLIGLSGE